MDFVKRRPYILFILPGFIIYTTFMIYPLFSGMLISFCSWPGIGPKKFIGLQNFYNLLFNIRTSEMFWNALRNNFLFVLCELFVKMPIAIFFAYFIYLKIRGHKLFQTLIFLPSVISAAIIGFFVMIIFDPNFGVLNMLFKYIGMENLQSGWFGDPNAAFPLFIIVMTWAGVGYGMVLFVANMRSIPEEIIEASIIDGAGIGKRLIKVILPMLWPSLTNQVVLATIYGLTAFDLPFIIGGPQGGVNNSLDFVNVFFYRYAFGNSFGGDIQVGFAASISVVVFLLVLIIAVIQMKFLKKLRFEY